MMRVIILTSGPYGTVCRCLPELVASDKIKVISVIMAEGGESSNAFKTRKRKFKKAIKIGILGTLNGIRMRPWFQGGPTEHIEVLCNKLSIPLHRPDALNSDRTVELFKAADADLGLSLGNRYISRRIFSIPRLGMINVHGERLPEYRNAQGVIWNIYNMERMTGLTIHEIDNKIDTGRIFYREEFPIEFHASLKETVISTTHQTSNKMPYAVRHVCENYDELSKQAKPQSNGKSYTTPTFSAFLKMVRNNRKLYESAPLHVPLLEHASSNV
jgi:methionyl-tRNA formyltransferase